MYSNLGRDTKDQSLKLPHWNWKFLTAPYTGTSKAVLEREREQELVHRDSTRPSIMYKKLFKENDPYRSHSQSEESRITKQVQNRQYIKKKVKAQQAVSYYSFYCYLKFNFVASFELEAYHTRTCRWLQLYPPLPQALIYNHP